MLTPDQIQAYCDRIHYTGSWDPTWSTLRDLHLAHLITVPFENLSIHWGEPIHLNEQDLFKKIVIQHRGGFCYELNGLFAILLESLGFQVQRLAARVTRADGSDGPEFDHLLLRVDQAAGSWLADVGFGDSFRDPLELKPVIDLEQHQDPYGLMVESDSQDPSQDPNWILWQWESDQSQWRKILRFSLQPRQLEDFAEMCHYHQTSPDSMFTRYRLCTRATPTGRITLSRNEWIVTEAGVKQEELLPDEVTCQEVLQLQFGITLGSGV